MVKNAINNDIPPATTKTVQSIGMRYAKSCNQFCIPKYEAGTAMTNAMTINFKKSFESKMTISSTDAPMTFRIPISFIRCSAVKVANPNSPRQEMKIATTEKAVKSLPVRCSVLYIASKLESRNWYSKGYSALYCFHSLSVAAIAPALSLPLVLTYTNQNQVGL